MLASTISFLKIKVQCAFIAFLLGVNQGFEDRFSRGVDGESQIHVTVALGEKASDSGKENYIVVFKDARLSGRELSARSTELIHKYGGNIVRVYSKALPGFVAMLTENQAQAIATDPTIKYVEEVRPVRGE